MTRALVLRRAAATWALALVLTLVSPVPSAVDNLGGTATVPGTAEGAPLDSPEAVWEQLRRDSKNAWDEASAVSQKAWETAREESTHLWNQATDEDTWRKAQADSEELWRKAQQQSKSAWDKAAQQSQRAWESASDLTQRGWDKTRSAVTGSPGGSEAPSAAK